MTRDIRERLELFMGGLEIRRLALNMPQVDEYAPPPNPAKLTDSRCAAYIVEYGDESWELDALNPTILAALVREEVLSLRDQAIWDEDAEEEERGRDQLAKIAQDYDDVCAYLEDR